jgi:transcription initiation factor IIF auxiliary subunit
MALHVEQSERYEGDGLKDHWWSWAVWVEGPESELDGIEYVEYTLHPTFPKPVRRIRDRATKFRLETGGWGVFTIYAKAVRKDGSVVPLEHELTLRFPDGRRNLA